MARLFRLFLTGAGLLGLGIILGLTVQMKGSHVQQVVTNSFQGKDLERKVALNPVAGLTQEDAVVQRRRRRVQDVAFRRPIPLPSPSITRSGRKRSATKVLRNLTAGLSGVMTKPDSAFLLSQGCSWHGPDDGECMVDHILQRYFHARMKNLTIEQVAEEEFGVLLEWDDNYPHSYPFMTADALRAMADVVVDSSRDMEVLESTKKDPTIRNGTLIYVEPPTGLLERFINRIVPLIRHSFILITINSVRSMAHNKYIDRLLRNPFLYHWFTQNAAFEDARVTPVPVGMKPYRKMEAYELFEAMLKDGHIPPFHGSPGSVGSDRDILVPILMNPSSNEEHRNQAIKAVEGFSTVPPERPGLLHYFHWLMHSKFVLSPPGHGEDCYRTWESVLFKAIPIVFNSSFYSVFSEAPCYIVDKWDSLDENQLLSFRPWTFSRKSMMAQYWMDKINRIRREIITP